MSCAAVMLCGDLLESAAAQQLWNSCCMPNPPYSCRRTTARVSPNRELCVWACCEQQTLGCCLLLNHLVMVVNGRDHQARLQQLLSCMACCQLGLERQQDQSICFVPAAGSRVPHLLAQVCPPLLPLHHTTHRLAACGGGGWPCAHLTYRCLRLRTTSRLHYVHSAQAQAGSLPPHVAAQAHLHLLLRVPWVLVHPMGCTYLLRCVTVPALRHLRFNPSADCHWQQPAMQADLSINPGQQPTHTPTLLQPM